MPNAIRAPAQRAVLSVLSSASAGNGVRPPSVGLSACFLRIFSAGERVPVHTYKYLSTAVRCTQARSTAQVLEAAQEDRRSTDARELLESVEASLRQQPSGPTKVRFDRITPELGLRVPARLPATLGGRCCPNPAAEAAKRASGALLGLYKHDSHPSAWQARRWAHLEVPCQQVIIRAGQPHGPSSAV